MSKERELLQRCLDEFEYKGVACNELCIDINKLLAQPEEGVYQKLLRIEKENYVEMLPSELWLDGYEAGKRSALLSKQPESNEPVAWKVIDKTNGEYMFSRVKPMERSYKYDVVIPLYTSAQKREPLSEKEIREGNQSMLNVTREIFIKGVRFAEVMHGIGVNDESI